MDRGTSLPGNHRLPIYPLRLLRLKEGEHAIIWVTHHVEGARIKGLFTRHLDGASQIISPEEAEVRVKGRPGVWKGYISACEWKQAEKQWVPCVVEVTERCEQDFRGKIERGQVWKIWRGPKDGKKKIPLRASFLESRPQESTPSALDVYPKLKNDIFRQANIPLTSDNPLPDLVVVVPEQGAAPGENPQEQPKPAERPAIRFTDRFQKRPQGIGEIVPHLNGEAPKKGGQQ
jgi:hypothetical protein